MKSLYLLFLLFLIPSFGHASFFKAISIKGGLGNGGNSSSTSLTTREQEVYGADLIIGYIKTRFVMGLKSDYLQWNQKSLESDLSVINLSGVQKNLAPLFGYADQHFAFFISSIYLSEFQLAIEDNDNNTVIYSIPENTSFSMQFLYNIPFGGHVGLEYNNMIYSKKNNDFLSGNETINLKSVLFILGINF